MSILNYKKKKIINDYINKKDFNISYKKLSSCSDKKNFNYLSVSSNFLGHLVYHVDAWNLSKEGFIKRLYTIRLAMDNSKYSKVLLFNEIKTNKDISIVGIELAEKLSIFMKRFNQTKSHNEIFYEVDQLTTQIRETFSNDYLFKYQKNDSFEYWSNVLWCIYISTVNNC